MFKLFGKKNSYRPEKVDTFFVEIAVKFLSDYVAICHKREISGSAYVWCGETVNTGFTETEFGAEIYKIDGEDAKDCFEVVGMTCKMILEENREGAIEGMKKTAEYEAKYFGVDSSSRFVCAFDHQYKINDGSVSITEDHRIRPGYTWKDTVLATLETLKGKFPNVEFEEGKYAIIVKNVH